MIGKLVGRRQEQERLERRAARLLAQNQGAAERAHRREGGTIIGPIDLGLRTSLTSLGISSKLPRRKVAWNKGRRMWSPSASEKCRRVEALLRYITAPETHSLGSISSGVEKCSYWNSRGFRLGTSIDDHIDEMSAVAAMVERGGDPIAHVILSLLPGEQPTARQADEAVAIFLREAKFEKCRAVWAVHGDRDHVHIHVVVNRVDAITRRMCRWGGDGGWSHDVLGRSVARIDALQGWTSARNARFTVEGDRVVPTRRTKGERGISQRARRYEIETGDASAERRARSAAARIDLDRISLWEDFHREAQAAGLRFEKSGRGLVVDIAGERIKASQVGRAFSLGRLEARFGEFRTTDQGGTAQVGSSSLVSDDLNVLQRDVLEIRDEFNSRRGVLRRRQAQERNELAEKHKAERVASTEGRDFRGKGTLLNDLRAELARRQLSEKSILRERHAQERKGLSASSTGPLNLTAFHSGSPEKRERDQIRARRFLDDRLIEIAPSSKSAQIDRNEEQRLPALRPFTIAGNHAGVVEWCGGEVEDPASLFFEDDGFRIRVPQTYDQTVLLAALTLADHRGGPVTLTIPDDLRRGFEDKIVALAAAHGISLADDRLERRRDDLVVGWKVRNELGLPRQQLFDEIHAAVGADAYAITIKKIGHEDGHGYKWSSEELGLDLVPPHVARACLVNLPKNSGAIPFLTPISHGRHLLVIDQLTLEDVEWGNRQGARPSLRVLDADLNFVVVSGTDILGWSRHVQARARDRVVSRLFGREANHPAAAIPLDSSRYKILPSTVSRTCPRVTKIFEEEVQEIERARSRDVERRLSAIPDLKAQLVEGTTTDIEAARRLSIYAAHARHIVTGVSRLLDDAVVDRLVAWRLKACGFAPDEVGAILSAGSPRVPKDRRGAEKYLARILSAARRVGEMDRRRVQLRAPTWKVITQQADDEVLNAFSSAKVKAGEQAVSVSRQELSTEPSPIQVSSDLGGRRTMVAGTGEDTPSVLPASVATPRRDDLPREAPLRASDPSTTIISPERPAAPPPVTTTPAWTMPPEVATWLSASLGKNARPPTVEAGAGTKPPPEPAPSVSGLNRRQAALAFWGGAPQQPASGRSQAALAIERLEAIIERDVRDFEKLRELRVQNGRLGDEDSRAKEKNYTERRGIYDRRQAELGLERRSSGLVSMVPNDLSYQFIWENDTQATPSSKAAPTEGTAVARIYRIFGSVLMACDEDRNVCHGADAKGLLEKGARKYCRFAVSRLHIVDYAKQLADPIPFIALFEQALVETGRTRDDISAARYEHEQKVQKPITAKPKGAVRPKGGGLADR